MYEYDSYTIYEYYLAHVAQSTLQGSHGSNTLYMSMTNTLYMSMTNTLYMSITMYENCLAHVAQNTLQSWKQYSIYEYD